MMKRIFALLLIPIILLVSSCASAERVDDAHANEAPAQTYAANLSAPAPSVKADALMSRSITHPVENLLYGLLADIENFDPANTDESKALRSNYFSMYNGKLVVRLPMGYNAFSFAALFIGEDITGANTLCHEYGHSLHLDDIGVMNYIMAVELPSLFGYWVNVKYDKYYSQPWEYTAERLGAVSGRYDSHGAAYDYAIDEKDWHVYLTASKFMPYFAPFIIK